MYGFDGHDCAMIQHLQTDCFVQIEIFREKYSARFAENDLNIRKFRNGMILTQTSS